MSNLISYLFETNAVKFCEEDKPFWLTSGKISPYFINTHFLYGNEKDATELLSYIDKCLNDKSTLPQNIFEKIHDQYINNKIYKDLIDTMLNFIKDNIDISEIDYISGGERRDWFFSNIISYLLKKPHISIFKDLSSVVSNYDFTETKVLHSIDNKKVLHIADIVTSASSYIRAWIPTIKSLNGNICWSCVVADRMQGGSEKLEAQGIKALSLTQIHKDLFKKAFELNIITENQLNTLYDFCDNPDETMKQFLITHPKFIENSLNSDEKTAKRAKLLIDGNLYELN